jgi:hypothetical protein
MIRLVRQDEDIERRKQEAKDKQLRDWHEYLRKIKNGLKAGDIDIIDGPNGRRLKDAENAVVAMGVEQIQKARAAVMQRGVTREIVTKYFLGLIEYIEANLEAIIAALGPGDNSATATGSGQVSQEQLDRALWEIRKERNLSEDFRLEVTPDLFNKRSVRRFRQLHDLAIVFTKTDMYPSVHPPENFPARNLPGCKLHLDVVENYLHLLGGSIRYYNASATGYSILRDTLYVPGPENTLTPINVIEPVFEMLGIR